MNITLLASEKTLRSNVIEREEEIKSLQETVQEILEDKQDDDVKLRTKLEVQEITINEKTIEIDDLKSILKDKEGI